MLGLALPGKTLGGLFQSLNRLNVLPHITHFQIISVFLGGQPLDLGPPRLGGDALAGSFQRVQVADGGIEQGKVGAVALLELLPLGRGNLVQLLANGLVFLILRLHFLSFSQNRNAALRFYDFAAQVVVIAVHGSNLVK